MNLTVSARVKTKICNAKSGTVIRESPWQRNLVLDNGLNVLARKSGISNLPVALPCTLSQNVIIGSNTAPTKISSGAITFTQAGTTLTASAGFFTAGMVGYIFKWSIGTAGNEVYITGFTSTTVVTVGTSATVSTPDVGAVWAVNQSGMQTQIAVTGSKSYQTNAGDCSTTYSGNTVTFQRTYIIPQQGSPYNVNEIGYGSNTVTTDLNACAGRLVLSVTDSVGTSNFYVIIIQLVFTYTPGAPTAVGNVGTNINTAGNAMMEAFCIGTVISSGSIAQSNAFLDASTGVSLLFATATYSQRGSITASATPLSITNIAVGGTVNWANDAATRGRMTLTFAGSVATTGQSLFGMGLGSTGSGFAFDVKFTATQTAPTGTFQPNSVFECVYNRTLTN